MTCDKSNASEQICFRVTRADKAELKRLAALAGMSLSAYLLRCAFVDVEAVKMAEKP